MRRCRKTIMAWVASGLSLVGVASTLVMGGAGPLPQPPATGAEKLTVSSAILERLGALDPARPEEYFRLGEDVADVYVTAADRRLAQQLFVLSFEIDRRQGGTARLAGSACMALAELAGLERDRKWLWALARAVEPRFERMGWEPGAPQGSPVDAYRAATALGLVRSGDGIAAQQLLKEPGVRRTIQRYERLLSNTGDTGGLRALEAEAQRWPCSECANARIVKKFNTNPAEYRLCTNCGGHPGPNLTVDHLVGQLRFESRLLRGIQRSWSAQMAADGGEPLRDPEVAELAAVFGIDPMAVFWRDGAWVKGKAEPAKGAPEKAPPKPVEKKDEPGASGPAGQ